MIEASVYLLCHGPRANALRSVTAANILMPLIHIISK